MLRIEVRDSGKGFAAEEQEQIAADLLRFNGRDLKGEGCCYIIPSNRITSHDCVPIH